MIILLDSGPLGLVTNPRQIGEAAACSDWMEARLEDGHRVFVPAIIDYEVRRELIRARRITGIARLDRLKIRAGYLPLTEEMLLLAAAFWATARQFGRPTASAAALDGDVILAAQAEIARRAGLEVVVATANVGHLALFTDARLWGDIV